MKIFIACLAIISGHAQVGSSAQSATYDSTQFATDVGAAVLGAIIGVAVSGTADSSHSH